MRNRSHICVISFVTSLLPTLRVSVGLVLIALILLFNTCYSQRATITPPNLPQPVVPQPFSPGIGQALNNSRQVNSEAQRRVADQDMLNYQRERERLSGVANQALEDMDGKRKQSVEEKSYDISAKVSHNYPVNRAHGVVYFEEAFKEINKMAEGKSPCDIKKAVFLTEHAYDTTLDYQNFQKQIAKLAGVIQMEMKRSKISANDNLGKIMAVYRFMADTITIKNSVLERTITTYPKTYDFEDFYGVKDYHNMFVSKLIRTGKGQCHSLPLMFLLLCQEIGAKAYLAYAPEHSYIKFTDKVGNLYNIELTNQMFTTDQQILASGYIKSAAIKSKIYMDTISMQRLPTYLINDLANTYVRKYGYDDFVAGCAKSVLEKEPNSVHAYMHLANYYSVLGMNIENQYHSMGINDRNVYFQKDQKLLEIVMGSMRYNKTLDELGYAEMPPEIYAKWLSQLKDERIKQQHNERRRLLNTMIEH